MVKTKKTHYPNSKKAMNFSTTLPKYVKRKKKEKRKKRELLFKTKDTYQEKPTYPLTQMTNTTKPITQN